MKYIKTLNVLIDILRPNYMNLKWNMLEFYNVILNAIQDGIHNKICVLWPNQEVHNLTYESSALETCDNENLRKSRPFESRVVS